ncbi:MULTISPECIES: hypothetical protein [Methylomonas]|uniref:DUF4145 domain-containing protein n=2 Tax=Methylomonas TaxID=416 RepID=A0A126T2P7_9GAMM|nr:MULTISPECIES: hypothetical protein [Methylomonas]AMK76004.1 hypothetical protein JT25_005780 [Methylomonas denitrificans]OAH99862.1 hypothetical protein A1342_16995 [Methylomonas methanica]TCV83977.1 hypothetical protein EDE11_108107 [Methylomonas methanica]
MSLPINAEFVTALLTEDEVGSVIRSHLYVEAQLSAFLELTVVAPKYLKDLDLSYAKKVELACCLGFDPQFRGALKRIGKLRNDFAHDLRSSLSKQVVADLFNALPAFGQQAVHISVGMLHDMCKVLPPSSTYDQLPAKMQFMLIALNLERICFAACEIVQQSRSKPR